MIAEKPLHAPASVSPTPEAARATLLPRVTAAAVDLLVVAPIGALAGLAIVALRGNLAPSWTPVFATAGAFAFWVAYRGTTDHQGRGLGRWLTGVRLLGLDGRAPGIRGAMLRAATGPLSAILPALAGTRVERSETLPLPERVGGAVGRNKVWLGASALSTVLLVAGSPMLGSHLGAGANLSAWERFHESHHDHGCCASRHELPAAWSECAGAIGGVLDLKAKGLFASASPAGARELFEGCTLVSAVEVAGATASETAVAPAFAAALDGSADARASTLAFLGPDPGGAAAILPASDVLLRRLVRDDDTTLALSAVAALRPLDVDRVRPLLVGADASLARAIDASSPGFREGAVYLLGLSNGNDQVARRALEPIATRSDSGGAGESRAEHAAHAAGGLAEAMTAIDSLLRRFPTNPRANEELAHMILDDDEREYAAALAALRRLPTLAPGLGKILEASLNGPDPRVRLAGAEALFAREPDHAGASAVLLRLLLDGDVEPVHRNAAMGLVSRLGATPKPLADALMTAAQEPDPEMHDRARAALSLRGLSWQK